MTRVLDWREVSREPIAECRIFSVERSTAESPTERARHSFYRIVSDDWAQIIPVTTAGEVVLVEQYRHGARRVTLEIPGGLVEAGEDPAVAAMRECLEETGYRAAAVTALGTVNPNPALFANSLHTFFAEGVERVADIQNTSTEHTAVVLVPLRQLAERLRSGEIDHGLVAAALWRYLHERPPI
jgi:8-oxo-dGTP pyrophosphatase MutT (NUDIX family)